MPPEATLPLLKSLRLLVAREVRDQLRDWRIVLPIFGLSLAFPFLANATAGQMVAFMERYGAQILTERLFPFLLLVVAFFPLSISLVIALEVFAGERERGTIEPLLAAPLSDMALYLGKLIAVLFLPLNAALVSLAAFLLSLGWRVGWWPKPILLGSVLLLTLAEGLFMVSAAVFVSLKATTVRSANLLASVIIIPIALLLQGSSLLLFREEYPLVLAIGVGLLTITLLLIRLGLSYFDREALLNRDWDLPTPGEWLAALRRGFRGTPPSRGLAWWRTSWQLAWREQRKENLFLTGCLLLAVLIGTRVGRQLSPTGALLFAHRDFSAISLPFVGEWTPWSIASLSAAALFLHNLRALLLIGGAGGLTFGALSTLFLMMPYGILGTLMEFFTYAHLGSRALFWLALVLPHGIAEIPATVLWGGALLRWGAVTLAPHPQQGLITTWMEGLGRSLRILCAVVLPTFLLAALLEAFLTPWVAARLLAP